MPGLDCNLFGPTEPCEPYLLYPPFRQELALTVKARDAEDSRRPTGKLNTLRDLYAAFRACWTPPPRDQIYGGMELTVRLSLNKAGGVIGPPRFTYVKRGVPPEQADHYRSAVVDSLRSCAPLPLTAGLGGAIAGRPIVILFLENRPPTG